MVADLLRRTGELSGLRVQVLSGGAVPGDLGSANVHPPVPGEHGDADVHLAGRVGSSDGPVGDGLVERLRVLGTPYAVPLTSAPHDGQTDMDRVTGRLAAWRADVARWAESPSAPIVEQARADLLEALRDDLDSPSALRVLDTVAADPDLPDGARFETFAWADRLLGLDLARDVGRP